MRCSLGKGVTELSQVTAQSIDQLHALTDETRMRTKSNGAGLMLRALDRHLVHVRSHRRFGNSCRIGGVVFLPLDERLHVNWRDQSDFVPKALRKPAPVVAGSTGFHRHNDGHLRFQQLLQLRPGHHAVV